PPIRRVPRASGRRRTDCKGVIRIRRLAAIEARNVAHDCCRGARCEREALTATIGSTDLSLDRRCRLAEGEWIEREVRDDLSRRAGLVERVEVEAGRPLPQPLFALRRGV